MATDAVDERPHEAVSADDEAEEAGASAAERLIGGAKRAQMELLEEALADPAGVDINAKDGIGNTALHYAALFGHDEVVERLLACGANPNAKNRQFETPLHCAISSEEVDIVRSLLQAGADPTLRTKQRQDAADMSTVADIKALVDAALLARRIDADAIASDEDDDDDEGDGDGADEDDE